ncbi:MAG: hypothetical protein PQ975_07245 [Methanobacterium sp.]|jgi:hypothetical protein
MMCLGYIGWHLFKYTGVFINPFKFILEIFNLSFAPSITGALNLITTLLGGKSKVFGFLNKFLDRTIGPVLDQLGLFEFVDNLFKLGDRFKRWLGYK